MDGWQLQRNDDAYWVVYLIKVLMALNLLKVQE